MKLSVLVFCGLLASAFSAENQMGTASLNRKPRFIFGIGDAVQNFLSPTSAIKYELYTRENRDTAMTLKSHDDNLGPFNTSNPTRIIVHGFFSNPKSLISMKEAYLSVNDYNVIMMDYSSASKLFYIKAALIDLPAYGEHLATLIDFLVSKGAKLDDIHIIGHSLGAHIAGVAGNRIASGKIPKITALDPASPFINFQAIQNHLNKNDAVFVEVIHTTNIFLGIRDPIGHADFYPNNGDSFKQGCEFSLFELPGQCAHTRAHKYFTESIVTKVGFVGYRCSSWDEFQGGFCYKNPTALMGEYTDPSASGVYFLETAGSPPFALGYRS